jgi:hypothetical protein
VPGLTSNGLRWTCSGDFVARQCLQYRGVLPVCAEASVGRPDGAVLTAALAVVRGASGGGGQAGGLGRQGGALRCVVLLPRAALYLLSPARPRARPAH